MCVCVFFLFGFRVVGMRLRRLDFRSVGFRVWEFGMCWALRAHMFKVCRLRGQKPEVPRGHKSRKQGCKQDFEDDWQFVSVFGAYSSLCTQAKKLVIRIFLVVPTKSWCL